MSYITKSNAIKMTKPIKNHDKILTGNIYEHMKIHFFSKYEKNKLLTIKYLFKNPEKYINEYYEKIYTVDSRRYVFEGSKPAYHKNIECELMYHNMINYEIPDDIKIKGDKTVDEFRIWFKSIQYLLVDGKLDIFAARLFTRWGINTNIQAIQRDNSGAENINNINIDDLINRINQKIKDAGRFYYKSDKNTKILSKFSKISFLAKSNKEIYGNDTGYSDEDVKKFLKIYNFDFKEPLKKDLIMYYKIKYNPNLEMKGKLLDQIGFNPCSKCHSKAISIAS